jgi:carboxyl-terminal processing protease
MELLMSSFRLSLLLAVSLLALPNCSMAQEAATVKDAPQQTEEETYKQLALFGEAFERVREKYVEPVTDEKLIEYAIKGMLVNLDPHSDYMAAKDFDDMKVQTKGEFGGLGIEVTMEDGLIKVISPIDDTPAFKAGVKAGDLIIYLDKKPIMGMTLSKLLTRLTFHY